MAEQKRKCKEEGCITVLCTYNHSERCFVHRGYIEEHRRGDPFPSTFFGGSAVARYFDFTQTQYQGRRIS